MIVLASSIGFIQECTIKFFDVVSKTGLRSLLSLVPFVIVGTCFLVIGMCTAVANSSGGIQNKMLWLRMPRTSLHLCSSLFVDMTTDLMFHHITSQPYQLSTRCWILFPLVGLCSYVIMTTTVLLLSSPSSVPDDDDSYGYRYFDDFILIYSTIAATYVAMKFHLVIREICIVLDIWCFDIVSAKPSLARGEDCAVDIGVTHEQHRKTD
jgi:hypothetical protein